MILLLENLFGKDKVEKLVLKEVYYCWLEVFIIGEVKNYRELWKIYYFC